MEYCTINIIQFQQLFRLSYRVLTTNRYVVRRNIVRRTMCVLGRGSNQFILHDRKALSLSPCVCSIITNSPVLILTEMLHEMEQRAIINNLRLSKSEAGIKFSKTLQCFRCLFSFLISNFNSAVPNSRVALWP